MDTNSIIEKFDRLEANKSFDHASPEDVRKFLQSFIDELNQKYRLNLKMADACKLVHENIHAFEIAPEMKEVLLIMIASLEFSNDAYKDANTVFGIKGVYWPL
jgi:hypothetical protein